MNRRTGSALFAALLMVVRCAASDDAQTTDVKMQEAEIELPELRKLEFGRDFVLTNQDGNQFDTATLRGKVIYLFFGYTTCPDACPMTLSKLARVHDLLGNQGERVQTVYVSVDPERDTVEKLKEYLDYYSLPVVGLTGTPEEVKSVAGDFGVFYARSEEETAAGYLVDHSTMVYVIDHNGTLRYLSYPDDSAEMVAALTRKILAEG